LVGNTLDDYGVAALNLYWGDKDTDTWTPITTLVPDTITTLWNWSYSFTPAIEGTFDIKATAVDAAGNVESTASI
jgi:hypothetical protein